MELSLWLPFMTVTLSQFNASAAPVATQGNYLTDAGMNLRAEAASDALDAAAMRSDLQGYSSSFAGVSITTAGLELSLTSDASDKLVASVQLTEQDTKVPVAIRSVKNSYASLGAISDQLNKDASSLRSQGVDLSFFGSEYASNKVVVHLRRYTSSAAALIAEKYGSPSTLTVATDSVSYEPSYGREADTVPWKGGDHIHERSSGTNCTSGFSMIYNSTYVASTAGHCGGSLWDQYTHRFGTAVYVAYGNSQLDTELMSTDPGASKIYSSGTGASTLTRVVKGHSTTQPVGGLVCTGGYVDSEKCNVRIDNPNVTDCYSGQCTQNTVLAHQQNGQAAFSPGDSGGPVYTALSTTGANAYGLIIAHRDGDNSYGAYQTITSILQYTGATLLVTP